MNGWKSTSNINMDTTFIPLQASTHLRQRGRTHGGARVQREARLGILHKARGRHRIEVPLHRQLGHVLPLPHL